MVAKECDAIACQRRSPRTAANCDERCRRQPQSSSAGISPRSLRKRRGWSGSIRLRVIAGQLRLLLTLRNKLRRTLRRLRQQLRHSLRASTSRLHLTVQLFRRTVQLLTAFRDLLLRVPAALVLVICAAPVVLRAENHNPVFLPHSSSASRLTAGASEFFIFSQSGERPER